MKTPKEFTNEELKQVTGGINEYASEELLSKIAEAIDYIRYEASTLGADGGFFPNLYQEYQSAINILMILRDKSVSEIFTRVLLAQVSNLYLSKPLALDEWELERYKQTMKKVSDILT